MKQCADYCQGSPVLVQGLEAISSRVYNRHKRPRLSPLPVRFAIPEDVLVMYNYKSVPFGVGYFVPTTCLLTRGACHFDSPFCCPIFSSIQYISLSCSPLSGHRSMALTLRYLLQPTNQSAIRVRHSDWTGRSMLLS